MAEQLLALANQARANAGASPLKWDPALAAAAMKHCERMVAEGPIAHRYGGEPDLTERAASAGAKFSLIEENVAVGQYADQIHESWMHSDDHRANLLNRAVDHIGIAVIAKNGGLYAVADFTQGAQSLTVEQAEAQVAVLVRMSGLHVRADAKDARQACAIDHGLPAKLSSGDPGFVMRWQSSDLGRLPQGLLDRLGSGQYKQASVGSCPAQDAASGFTMYRMAVLLY